MGNIKTELETTPSTIFKTNNRKVLYLDIQYGKIKRKGYRLEVFKDDEKKLSIPAFKISKIIALGNISISPPAIGLLLNNNIALVYLNSKGRYKGTFEPQFSKNSILQYKQIKILITDQKKQLYIAKAIIKAKLLNIKFNIQRRIKEKKILDKDKITMQKIIRNIQKIETAKNISELLGLEGYTSKLYFSLFNYFILNKEFTFAGRHRRPPKDEVNALLSFGYSVLVNEFVSLCYEEGLNPYFGYLHQLRYGNPCLALDMIEPFRVFFIDNLVLFLINDNIIQKKYFKNSNGGIFLNKKGIDIFLKYYEEKKEKEIHYNNKKYRIKDLFELQVRQLAYFITERTKFLSMITK